MEKTFSVETTVSPNRLFEVVHDLTTYPSWIEMVHKVEPADSDGVWWVTLRAKLGPLARSKRLRMKRAVSRQPTKADSSGEVRFERDEVDGRDHSEWTMEVHIESDANGNGVARCRLFYGGGLWNGLLDGQLDAAAKRSTTKLQELVAE